MATTTRIWEGMIAEVQALSTEMLDLAKTGQWEEVIEREGRRRSLLQELFTQPLQDDGVASIQACIQQVLASDAQVLTMGREHQATLAHHLGMMSTSQKAQAAYAEHY